MRTEILGREKGLMNHDVQLGDRFPVNRFHI